jgi:hypothetical protein
MFEQKNLVFGTGCLSGMIPGSAKVFTEAFQELFPNISRVGLSSRAEDLQGFPDGFMNTVSGPEITVGQLLQAVGFPGKRRCLPFPSSPGTIA